MVSLNWNQTYHTCRMYLYLLMIKPSMYVWVYFLKPKDQVLEKFSNVDKFT